jgi:hypothetical protein
MAAGPSQKGTRRMASLYKPDVVSYTLKGKF